MKKILIPTLLTLSSTPLICLAGCNEPKEPIGDRLDFNTCDWSEIINACNKLEEGEITNAEFCKKFKFDSTPAKNLNDFVGKTRIVNINSQDHIVRVDGVKQDYLDETHEQPVVFTFEFENLISDVNGHAIKTKWNTTNLKNYWESTLCDFLNNDEDDGVTSVYEMIKASNETLAQGIKSVSRGVNTDVDKDKTYVLITKNTKLFCPVLSNLFSLTGLSGNDQEWISNDEAKQYCNEGQQYKYYANQIKNGKVVINDSKWQHYPCIIKKDCKNATDYYWLTSLITTSEIEGSAWYCCPDAKLYYRVVDQLDPVAPCFCL